MSKRYYLHNIRTLLNEGFTDEELRRLCYDAPDFRPVYDELATETGKAKIVDRLVEYAEQKLQLGILLALAKEHNPARYEQNQPYEADITSPTPGESPYLGLQYFDEADADLFFGRELLTAKLVGCLREHRFLAIVGASGSGKSSIARAGLVPALKRGEVLADGSLPPEGSTRWPIYIITPTTHPLEALAASLTRDADSVRATATLMDDLANDARSLHLYARKILSRSPSGKSGGGSGDRLLLLVDQFEELFTLCRDEAQRRAFVHNLLTAAAPETAGPTLVVITLRADFYVHCVQFDDLREALAKRQEFIGPMSKAELRRAIEEPAKRGGWVFEPGLVDLLLRDVGDEPGALPLLSHALLETWKHRRENTLTFEGYFEAGRVQGAIAKTAETVFNQRLSTIQQGIARTIFLKLTELGEGTQDTRRRVTLAELMPLQEEASAIETVLKIMADARLITIEKETVEVAHEAIIREWPTLRRWLDENREGLRTHRRLTQATWEWAQHNHDESYLYRGARLAEAKEWAEIHSDELNGLERTFLEASLAEQERELQKAQERESLQRERDLIGTLYEITRELSASFDLDRVLVEALHLINRAIGISQGSILLVDHETNSLIYRAALGRAQPLPRFGLKTQHRVGYGLAGKVIETRQPRIVPDLSADPDWIVNEERPDCRSALVVPLITGEDVLGALMLYHPDINYFTEDHLNLSTAAGAQIAVAINNAELYRLTTDQAQRLAAMFREQAAEAARNQAILKGITDGVLVLDSRRHIMLVNPKAAEILNVDAQLLENQSVHQSLGQSAAAEGSELAALFYQHLSKLLPTLETSKQAAEFRIEGNSKVVAVTLVPLALGGEELSSIVAVLRDISKQVEIDRIKNEFIAAFSHELRTPLVSIKGYAQLLTASEAQVGELNPTQHQFVQVIQTNADRLTELVNDFLEISRLEARRVGLEFESLDLIALIEEVAISFEAQTQKAMILSLNLPSDLPPVHTDRARVTQILVNLIGNAWQYTPAGGRIIIRAHRADQNFVQIDVEDTGIGIAEEELAHVFDRFFRSARAEVQTVGGHGLGLSISKMFVEMLGGKIWVKSQLNVGSTFSFTLPIAVDPISPSQQDASWTSPDEIRIQ